MMEKKHKAIEELLDRIDRLARQQQIFHDEIYRLHQEVIRLKESGQEQPAVSATQASAEETTTASALPPPPRVSPPIVSAPPAEMPPRPRHERSAWEDFIGTNLLNKVGIAVLVLGVAFGTKYSIDNQLLDPLTRIVLGYVAGIALVAVALRLRESHTAFSAVLLSGGMAVFYFITYAAHGFYDLIPQVPAFVLMVMFTVFTVFASLRYNLEAISIIALVGAYAVPFLLSDGSGRVLVLFSYITIINTGILVLAFRKYWKRLYYLAFGLTWLTFASWYAFSYRTEQHAAISLVFSAVFFITFYATFLVYKVMRRESLGRGDVICMVVNSFLFYGYGYLTVESLPAGDNYLGIFTLLTALIHFAACVIIYKSRQGGTDIFYFAAGMVLVFLTIAIPVQLEGHWVTLFWAGEALLMFWIGRVKGLTGYEKLSYPLILLALLSLLHDWSAYPQPYFYDYEQAPDFRIFLNVRFLTSALVGLSIIVMARINMLHNADAGAGLLRLRAVLPAALPLLAIAVLYVGIYKEIEAYWYGRYAASRIPVDNPDGSEYYQYNYYLLNFKNIWLLIFSALFATALSLLAQWRWQTRSALLGCLAFNALVLLSFVATGLAELSALREGFLSQPNAAYYDIGKYYLSIRYVAIASVIPLLWFNSRIMRFSFAGTELRRAVHLYLHLIVLIVLSSELIHWLDIARVENSFRLSLSILWGAYALMLIVYGLSRDLKHIRIAAIALFAVTLLKLFAYDMAGMSTILKTVVMIILGVLLLTASFIYNKFKRPAGNEAR